MADSDTDDQRIPLTAQHVVQMERDASAALARRSGGWLFEQGQQVAELAIIAGLSLASLLLWGAPALTMLLLLLASTWVGILGEWLKFLLLRDAVRCEVANSNADQFVWNVVDALQSGRGRIRRTSTQASYQPGTAIVLDFAFGGMATLAILAAIGEGGHDWRSALELDRWLQYAIGGALAIQLIAILWVILRHRSGRGEHAPPRFAAGGRGLGLFVLVFVLIFAGDEGRNLHLAMIATNLLLLLLAALGVFGVWLMSRETRWLAAHLRERARARAGKTRASGSEAG